MVLPNTVSHEPNLALTLGMGRSVTVATRILRLGLTALHEALVHQEMEVAGPTQVPGRTLNEYYLDTK